MLIVPFHCSFPYSSPAIGDTWVQLAVVYDLQVSVSVLWKMIPTCYHKNKMFRQALCSGYYKKVTVNHSLSESMTACRSQLILLCLGQYTSIRH